MNILIVDDSATMRRLVRRALRGTDYSDAEIHEASDGAEALAVVEDNRIDLILSDMNMPNMSGLEMLQKLQELPKEYRVIMITTEADTKVAEELKSSGAAACIGKPFTSEQLGRAIDALF